MTNCPPGCDAASETSLPWEPGAGVGSAGGAWPAPGRGLARLLGDLPVSKGSRIYCKKPQRDQAWWLSKPAGFQARGAANAVAQLGSLSSGWSPWGWVRPAGCGPSQSLPASDIARAQDHPCPHHPSPGSYLIHSGQQPQSQHVPSPPHTPPSSPHPAPQQGQEAQRQVTKSHGTLALSTPSALPKPPSRLPPTPGHSLSNSLNTQAPPRSAWL